MAKVITTLFVRNKLDRLIRILYKKEYFGFRVDAEKYVHNIVDFIYNIPKRRYRKTKNPKYGVFYCRYKPNKKTTWFVTFDMEDDVYIVKNVTNNHSEDYPTFIAGFID